MSTGFIELALSLIGYVHILMIPVVTLKSPHLSLKKKEFLGTNLDKYISRLILRS